MMDFTPRIDDLCGFLADSYGLVGATDPESDTRLAVELLLASLLVFSPECPAARMSLCLDTEWMSVDCSRAWFAFGGLTAPRSLAVIRSVRPRGVEQTVAAWDAFDQGAKYKFPRLYVDPDSRTAWKWHPRARTPAGPLAQTIDRALHVRVRTPKSLASLALGSNDDSRRSRLAYLTRKVVESEVRQAAMPKTTATRELAYYTELCVRACGMSYPGYRFDWVWLASACAFASARLAALYGKAHADARSQAKAARVLTWQLPPWTAWIIGQANDATAFEPRQLVALGGYDRETVRRDVRRLVDAGVLHTVAKGTYRTYKDETPAWGALLSGVWE